MNRIEIEYTLNKARNELLKTYSAYTEEERLQPLTPSEANPDLVWTMQDHLVHFIVTEVAFNHIIQRFLAGKEKPVELFTDEAGEPYTQEQTMAIVDKMNDEAILKHRGKSFDEVVTEGQKRRAETLALLASLSDEQLASVVPGAPWGGGTVGGILQANVEHALMHHEWIQKVLKNK